jgi:hypothetical protein
MSRRPARGSSQGGDLIGQQRPPANLPGRTASAAAAGRGTGVIRASTGKIDQHSPGLPSRGRVCWRGEVLRLRSVTAVKAAALWVMPLRPSGVAEAGSLRWRW